MSAKIVILPISQNAHKRPQFVHGDAVMLKSSGPVMTVMEFGDGGYLCAWPSLNDAGPYLQIERFREEVLTLIHGAGRAP